jgi:hypothetical protein
MLFWPEIAFVLVRVPWSFNRVVLTRTEVEDDVNLTILIKVVIINFIKRICYQNYQSVIVVDTVTNHQEDAGSVPPSSVLRNFRYLLLFYKQLQLK